MNDLIEPVSNQGNTIISRPRTQKVWCRQCNSFHSTMDVQAMGIEEELGNTVFKFRCWNNNNDGTVNLRAVLVDEYPEDETEEIEITPTLVDENYPSTSTEDENNGTT